MSESFDAYRDRMLSRHENTVTNVLSTIGDLVVAGGIAAAVATRQARVGVMGVSAGFAIAAIAHLFQPGTLRDEIVENLRHPLWAYRSELQRVFGRRA
jgi:hypothetical protein